MPAELYCAKCGAKIREGDTECPVCRVSLVNADSVKKIESMQSAVGNKTTFDYAGFWKRFGAYILDSIVLAIPTVILIVVLGVSLFRGGGLEATEEVKSIGNTLGNLFGIVIGWLYFSIMESSSKQATLGKLALGIKVTDANGNRISFGRATGRHFSKIISGAMLAIGYLMIAFTEKKQGLHDMITGCLVVNK